MLYDGIAIEISKKIAFHAQVVLAEDLHSHIFYGLEPDRKSNEDDEDIVRKTEPDDALEEVNVEVH